LSTHKHLRDIPAVEKIVSAIGDVHGIPRPLVVGVAREHTDRARVTVLEAGSPPPPADEIISGVREELETIRLGKIQSVINGTGVIIHTNLGRSPMGQSIAETVSGVITGYSNLEFDLGSGGRGPRARFLETGLAQLSGAGAATAVNNCAAALFLILKHLIRPGRDEVIISRSELIEIGGGFRIPEILETSGARLREVGTTNRTRLSDYGDAIGEKTALVLKVHQSNFSMEGFVASPGTEELSALCHEHSVPIVEDLGSGALLPTDQLAPIAHEPTPKEIMAAGVDLVCFSGDKLLGGPQSGIIAGRADLIAGIKKDPFYRAVRCDKFIFTVLQETVATYLDGGATPDIPTLTMLALPESDLRERAEKITATLPRTDALRCKIGQGVSRCGGGTMPKSEIPSVTLDLHLKNCSPEDLSHRLRTGGVPPVVGYVSEGTLKLDLRTVFPRQDELLTRRLGELVDQHEQIQDAVHEWFTKVTTDQHGRTPRR